MVILVDAMGGDNAPGAIVDGCIDAIREKEGFEILLLGDSQRISDILKKRNFNSPRLKIQHTSDVITNDDAPTRAIKSKKESSMVVGFNLLKEKKGDVFISAGNSGALMTGALLLTGRIKGVDRPALPAVIPTKKGKTLIIDAGLNTVCKPINYLQFAVMGSIFMKEVFGIEKPRVGLLNVGSEDKKGNEIIKQARTLLLESKTNFIGNIEGKDIPEGKADVVVCDGFVGNVVLKFLEGVSSFFFGKLKEIFMSSPISKIGALMLKKELRKFVRQLDPDENGGALIIGINRLVIKSHGSSNAKTIKHVIFKAKSMVSSTIIEQIAQQFTDMEVEDIDQDT